MYGIDSVKAIIDVLTGAIHENKDYLGELDGHSGDGDLGFSMESAFGAIKAAADAYEGTEITQCLMKAAMDCNKAAPSTMGTLVSAGVMGIAKASKGKEALSDEDVAKLPGVIADAIMARGKAKLGDKTILDALIPMSEEVVKALEGGASLKDAYVKGAAVAREKAEATAGMQAQAGRAKWLGERAAEYPDGGAIMCAILAESLVKF